MCLNTATVNSKITSPPAGSSGDPFTNATCVQSGCHGGSVGNASSTNLTLTIGTSTPTTPLDNSFQYVGGTQYNIGFLINAFTGRYGFQFVALDANNNQAGTMTVTNQATTKINTSAGTGSRQYMGHLNASSTKNWVFRWTAPAASTGPVSFYYSFATEDGDGNPGSNVVFKGNVTIAASSVGVEDISNVASGLRIFPNPVSNEVGLSFDLLEPNDVNIELYSIDGKMNKSLHSSAAVSGKFSEKFDISELPSGVYLLKLKVGNATTSTKIFKQ